MYKLVKRDHGVKRKLIPNLNEILCPFGPKTIRYSTRFITFFEVYSPSKELGFEFRVDFWMHIDIEKMKPQG